jgi:hypothetical protein
LNPDPIPDPKHCLISRVFQKGLGLSLREVHLDQWSLTEVLRLHLEASGAFRGHNLQNWRYQQRGGFRLSDDPGFQFCREEPQILGSLQSQSVYELRQDGTPFWIRNYFLWIRIHGDP